MCYDNALKKKLQDVVDGIPFPVKVQVDLHFEPTLHKNGMSYPGWPILLEQDARRPSSVNPRVPHALDPIVARLLAKDVDARYADARELHDALVATLPRDAAALRAVTGAFVAEITALKDDTREGTVVVEMPPPTVPSASVMLVDTKEDAAVAPSPSPSPRRSRAPIAVAASAIGVALVAAFALVASSRDGATTPIGDAGPSLASVTPPVAVAAVDAGTIAATIVASVDAGAATTIAASDTDEEQNVEGEPQDEPPVGRARIARKRVQLVAPPGITWRARVHGDVAEVSAAANVLVAVDGYGGVHRVPVQNGKADYAALPTGELRVWLPPTGGEVFLGAKSVGQARVKIDVVVGRYKVRAKLVDNKIEEQSVVVTPGKNVVRFGPK